MHAKEAVNRHGINGNIKGVMNWFLEMEGYVRRTVRVNRGMSYWRNPPLNVHIKWFFIVIIFLVGFVRDGSCQNILKDSSPRVEDIINCICHIHDFT